MPVLCLSELDCLNMALTEPAFNGKASFDDRRLSDSTAHNLPEETAPRVSPTTKVDGGLTAWLQCAGAFFLFFNSWGIVNTFGTCHSAS